MRRLASLPAAFGRHHSAASCCCRSLASKAGPVVDAGNDRKQTAPQHTLTSAERDDSVLSDEDLTAVPTGAARPGSQRASPRAGSATAWKKPGFAAATSDAAERAAFQRAFRGTEAAATTRAGGDDDIASIERDIESLKAADRAHRIQLPSSSVASDDDIAGGALYADELSATEGDDDGGASEWRSDEEVELDDQEAEGAAAEYERMVSVLRAPKPGARLFGTMQEGDGETAAAALAATAAQGPSLPSEGLAIDYCVFCYHGTHILRHDNMALLTKFVSERGFILPKRFTKCCAKHQRTLAKTIKRSRWMNLIPWHSKLHPKLRFSSMKPEPVTALQGSAGARSPAARTGGEARSEAQVGGDRGAPLSSLDRHAMTAAVAEINRFAGDA